MSEPCGCCVTFRHHQIAAITVNILVLFVGAAIDRSVRLFGGDDSREGIVEIAYNGRWGMLCDGDLSAVDAQSICGGLGYGTDEAEVIPASSSK